MKRFIDVMVSFIGLLLLSPVVVVTAILIRIQLGNPVIFSQDRPGLHGNIFCLYKFRTMTDERDADGRLLPDDLRLTRVGRVIRRLSIDELPQLVNVFKGDMSLIGPRPLLVEYLPLYSEDQMRRHHVRPGITGWAQVNGRNSVGWRERFELDVWYVDHQSFLLDLKIILMTLRNIVSQDGISEDGRATMSKFSGNEENGSKLP